MSDGIEIQYLPVNQAWLVTFGRGPEASRLAGPFNHRGEAEAYVADLRSQAARARCWCGHGRDQHDAASGTHLRCGACGCREFLQAIYCSECGSPMRYSKIVRGLRCTNQGCEFA